MMRTDLPAAVSPFDSAFDEPCDNNDSVVEDVETSDGFTILYEPGNRDGWIASDNAIDLGE